MGCSAVNKIILFFFWVSDELEQFMENQGASSPGILILTTSLSKPFMRLEKYVTLLQELERHMEVREGNAGEFRKYLVFKAIWDPYSLLPSIHELPPSLLSPPKPRPSVSLVSVLTCWLALSFVISSVAGNAVKTTQEICCCGISNNFLVEDKGEWESENTDKTFTLNRVCL